MSFIRARCAVEIALDAGVRKLQRDLAGAAVRSGVSINAGSIGLC